MLKDGFDLSKNEPAGKDQTGARLPVEDKKVVPFCYAVVFFLSPVFFLKAGIKIVFSALRS